MNEGAAKSNKGSGYCVISAACNAGIPVSRTASRKPVMDGALDISKFWLIGAENPGNSHASLHEQGNAMA